MSWRHLLLLSLISTLSPAGPLTFSSALPLPKGQNIVREIGLRLSKKKAGAKITVLASKTVLGFSLNEKTALFAVLPYLDKKLSMSGIQRNSKGLGDMQLFSRFTLHIRNLPGRTQRTSLFSGIKAPTGEWHATDALGELPRGLQVGTGAWEGFLGFALSDQAFEREWDSAFQIRWKGRRGGLQKGVELKLDSSYQHRLLPRTLPSSGIPTFLYGILELNFKKSFKDRQSGAGMGGSSSNTLHLVPGLQLVSVRWVAELGVSIPLLQSLPSGAFRDDPAILIGFRGNF